MPPVQLRSKPEHLVCLSMCGSLLLTLINQLEGKQPLVPRALHVIDGNYSSKRAANAGHVDHRSFKSDYLLSRDYVNQFQYEVKGRAAEDKEMEEGEEVEVADESDAPWVGLDTPGDAADGQGVPTP